jgi:hypothetical protein
MSSMTSLNPTQAQAKKKKSAQRSKLKKLKTQKAQSSTQLNYKSQNY